MTRSTTRLAAITAGCALGVIAFGLAWEASRFGLSAEAEANGLRADVRRRFEDAVRRVESLANRAAGDDTVITHFSTAADRPDPLFARLSELTRAGVAYDVSVTLHAPAGPVGAYRVAAWSDGPAGDLTAAQLATVPSMFVASGAAGLRLVVARPIESGGRRLGVATAEAVFAPATAPGSESFSFPSSFGPVPVARPGSGQGALPSPFVLAAASGQPLLEAGLDAAMVAEGRQEFRRRVVVVGVLPLLVLLLPTISALQARRFRSTIGPWAASTLAVGGLVAATAVSVAGLAAFGGASPEVLRLVWACGAFALAASVAPAAWWRHWPRLVPRRSPARFAAEQLTAGLTVAALVWLLARALGGTTDSIILPRWQLPIFSTDASALAGLSATLLFEIALGWAAAGLLALIAIRWRLGWRRTSGWLAAGLWIVPTVALLAPPVALAPPVLAAAGAAAGFGLFAGVLRRLYRHASQVTKLVLLFSALLMPVVATYPLAAAARDRVTRLLIEQEYGPAAAGAQRADRLHAALTQAQREIDAQAALLAPLPAVPAGTRVESQAAFRVWSQTSLSRDRVTSDIELFGHDLRLVSRFALNVPQFEAAYQQGVEVWRGAGCEWDAYAEVNRFGAEERRRLHAERGICDAQGRLVGAVVIHVLPDYRGLPFVSSADPYFDVVARPAARPAASRVPDLEVVVYGWNLQPLFSSSSGRVTWALPADVDDRLYQSREPFWSTLAADSRDYRVHFLSDRGGIFAVGYPRPTAFHHLTRLSELFAITAAFFVLLVAGLAAYAPFAASWRGASSPLRVVLQEIRTSFYRKLFLFFLLAATGPVVLFAAAFGAYAMARFSADIRLEAASVVTVARRVFEELAAAGRSPDQAARVSDDVMVWIRQVINQDVNLYEGPRLLATSQRDLFDSGLLPTRTPASVYREVALRRAPTFVAPDRLGEFQYLVAAAPVRARGREALLTVPLASRQREVEREIADLNRGVLVGVVVVVLFAAALGASVAGRVSDPVSRLTRATRLIAAGRLDIRLVADTADELGRLVEDFNAMAHTLLEQRTELARANQLKAWAEMARQVAHEIKNPLTPIQLAAEHLRHVHEDSGRPLGRVFDQCIDAILNQVRLLRQIAAEFSSFGSSTTARPSAVNVPDLVESVTGPYRPGLADRIRIETAADPDLPAVWVDRVLIARALANLVEIAIQAMPGRGALSVTAAVVTDGVAITVTDTGPGMEPEAIRRAFEPYFSTKTAGSGLGLANAKRNVELCGGTIALSSAAGQGTTVTITLPAGSPGGGIAAASPPGR